MGVLLQVGLLNESAFDALWEGWQLGSRPKGVSQLRMAMKIEDRLCGVSAEKADDDGAPRIACPKCRERFEQRQFDRFNFWRVPTMRKLKDGAEAIFMEDADFTYLKEALQNIEPPQPRVRDYVAVWDLLEAAEKEKGDEPTLRKKLTAEAEIDMPQVVEKAS